MKTIAVFSKLPNLLKELRHVLPSVQFHEIKSDKDEELKSAEILIGDFDLCGPVIYDLPKLKWLQGTWAGVDKLMTFVDLKNPPPFTISRFSGEHFGRIMGEYVLANIVNYERGLFQLRDNQKTRKWTQDGNIGTYRVVSDLTFGILGVGSIGNRVGQLLHSLGGTIIGLGRSSRYIKNDEDFKYMSEYFTMDKLPEALKKCDYLINVLPNTPQTVGLLNGTVLENCKEKQTIFINIGRGSVISDKDLIESLNKKWISAAILDVFNTEPLPVDNPLWNIPQVYISPHCSGMSRPKDIAEQFSDFYKLYNENKPIPTKVDFKAGY